MNFIEFLRDYRKIEPPLSDKYGEWLGYEIVDVDLGKGEVRTLLKIREEHLSPSSAVHGGVISGFLDFSCGCAAFATLEGNQLCSTVELNVKYFRPLKEGDEIVAEAIVVHRGKRLCSVVANLYRNSDKKNPVAMATGTFNVYEAKSWGKSN